MNCYFTTWQKKPNPHWKLSADKPEQRSQTLSLKGSAWRTNSGSPWGLHYSVNSRIWIFLSVTKPKQDYLPSQLAAGSQIPDWLRLGGTSGDHPVRTPAQRQSSRSGLYLVRIWISSWMETLQPLCATCTSVWSPLEQKKGFLLPRQNSLFQFVATVSCPVPGHHWEESVPIVFTPPIKYFYT